MEAFVLSNAQSTVNVARATLTAAQARLATLRGEKTTIETNLAQAQVNVEKAFIKKEGWAEYCRDGTCLNALKKLNFGGAAAAAGAKLQALTTEREWSAEVAKVAELVRQLEAKDTEIDEAEVDIERKQETLDAAEAKLEQALSLVPGARARAPVSVPAAPCSSRVCAGAGSGCNLARPGECHMIQPRRGGPPFQVYHPLASEPGAPRGGRRSTRNRSRNSRNTRRRNRMN